MRIPRATPGGAASMGGDHDLGDAYRSGLGAGSAAQTRF